MLLSHHNMRRFLIQYDRTKCIEIGACAVVNPDVWEINPIDWKADLIGGTKKNSLFEKEVEHADEKLIESAKCCPAGAIKIFDKNTGQQIV